MNYTETCILLETVFNSQKKSIRNIIKTNLFKILLDFCDICYKKNKIKIILFVYFKRFSNK